MPPTARASLPEATAWPLIGREAEAERMASLRTAAGCSGLVVNGPAGVGKSRLARHATAVAEREGALVEWVLATRSAATVPFGAFAGLLPRDSPAGEPVTLMRASARTLLERAEGRPVVLGVDDAQLLDPTSAALVLHLSATRSAFVVATVRAGEPPPDAIESLWKDAGAVRMDLEPLGEAATSRLVEAVLGGPVEERIRRWVFDTSRGNVLYVRELLLGALADGSLESHDGFWRLTRRPAPSQSLAEIIRARMEDLAPEERRVLQLLALGEPLELSEITRLAGTDAVAEVEARGLVTVAAPSARGEVRVAHPLYGEVVRSSMPALRAREARLALAALVGRRAERTPADALRVARWLLDAGEPIAGALAAEAAGAALPAGDPELGARLAQLALDDGAGPEAALLLARAHAQRKRFAEAEAVLAGVENQLERQDLALEYLDLRTTVLFWSLRRRDEALAVVARARDWWPEPTWRRRLEPLRVYLVFLTEGPTASLAETEGLLAEPGLEPGLRRRVELIHATNLFHTGHARDAHALSLRLRPPVPLRDANDEVALDICTSLASETGEDLQELDDWLTRTLAEGARVNDHAASAIAAVTLADVRRRAGRFEDAARWIGEAVAQFERRDPFGYLPLAYGLAAGVAFRLGDADGAAAAIAKYRAAQGGRTPHETERPYRARIEAWGLLAAGDPPAAQKLLRTTAAEIEAMPIYAASLYYEAMRAGAPARAVAAPLAALRERSNARLVVAFADHAAARAAQDGAALLQVTEDLALIGTTRFACECAAHAAEAFAAAGREDSARRAATRCRELHALGQGGSLPALADVEDMAPSLTAREAQLVELAARGLTNAQIAERLVVSVRTVESHLYRAMQKLGISDRRDLRLRP